ncbi:hypothetical protein PsorP6_007031 [Peronosclerospora sorghi]|uniref:Uncharacterized protein n=1 Tax=Peronosclerospora sorghi TaxID=230839 RepID=A0ACC0WB01_9STRA|nr:hypothetical protein PsorP6_007031 [Peronosclerospora sorghi]
MGRHVDGHETKDAICPKHKVDEIGPPHSADNRDGTSTWLDDWRDDPSKGADSTGTRGDQVVGPFYAAHRVGRTRVPWHSKSPANVRHPDAVLPRIVAFDVRGKLFRCKESLIATYPHKRLHQLIHCSCGTSSCLDDAFFIDRNPQHFEMILDWYRTGKLVRQRNVSEDAFKADAMYFDLYEELFPTARAGDAMPRREAPAEQLPISTRRRSAHDVDVGGRSKTKRVSMFASLPSPPATLLSREKVPQEPQRANPMESSHPGGQNAANPDARLRFCRHERRRLTPSSMPLVFMMRQWEQLLVESVTGQGKLMVRVCDASGMETVDVPEALVWESPVASPPLPLHVLFPGNHVYTFWMLETGTDPMVVHGGPPTLELTFQLVFTFNGMDRVTSTMEVALARASSHAIDARAEADASSHEPGELDACRPCLFLPPSHVINGPTRGKPLEQAAWIRHAGAGMMRAAQRVSSS